MLLKYTSPGVPDLYQGNELMDDSLVDPDNRRPVDYAWRARLLDEAFGVANGAPEAIGPRLSQWASAPGDGRAKLWLTWRLLSLRREKPQLFQLGSYLPLEVRGRQARHVVAFVRRHGDACVLVLVVRLFATLDGGSTAPAAAKLPVGASVWHDTSVLLPDDLAAAHFDNPLTGAAHSARDGRLALAECFSHFPGAVLVARQR